VDAAGTKNVYIHLTENPRWDLPSFTMRWALLLPIPAKGSGWILHRSSGIHCILESFLFIFFFLKLLILFPENHRRGNEKETFPFVQIKTNSKINTMFTCTHCCCGYPEYFRHIAKGHSCFLALVLTACVQTAFLTC